MQACIDFCRQHQLSALTSTLPSVLQAYIDFEISERERTRARILYERMLDRTKHVKVWLSFATFEAQPLGSDEADDEADGEGGGRRGGQGEQGEASGSGGGDEGEGDERASVRAERARAVYTRAFKSIRENQPDGKEEAQMVLEAWRDFEAGLDWRWVGACGGRVGGRGSGSGGAATRSGCACARCTRAQAHARTHVTLARTHRRPATEREEAVAAVERKMPKRVKRKRPVRSEAGVEVRAGREAGGGSSGSRGKGAACCRAAARTRSCGAGGAARAWRWA